MTSKSAEDVTIPFPISKLAHRFLLYDANNVAYIRAHHNIPGVLIGSLPQHPSQNVFCGLPLELMPEEARLLVEKGVAYIADDYEMHTRKYLERGLSVDERRALQMALRKQGLAAAKDSGRRAMERKRVGLARRDEAEQKDMSVESGVWNDLPADMASTSATKKASKIESSSTSRENESPVSSATRASSRAVQEVEIEPFTITPTTSDPPLHHSHSSSEPSPQVSSATYPLYTHLHSQGYFLSPGLRFGCNYMAYPGDPLRFHAHFLCRGLEWEQEFDLLELVGGGRLGTGVKKGFLLGGREDDKRSGGVGRRRGGVEEVTDEEVEGDVRTFCIEWAGM